jgi:hypothetical protein
MNRVVNLHWIPAHTGYSGNEEVDALAKAAAEMPLLGPEPALPLPFAAAKGLIRGWLRKKHSLSWNNREDCRQSREVLKGPSRNNRSYCLGLGVDKLRQLVRVVTGFGPFAVHMHTIGIGETRECSRCSIGEEEDRNHFLCSCMALDWIRVQVFGNSPLSPEDLREISLQKLSEFIDKSGKFNVGNLGDLTP